MSKNFGRKPIFYTRSPDFSGGNILEPKQCLVAGEISSRRENCWQRSPPAKRCRCGKQLSLPQKSEDVAVCGGGDTRDRLVLASNFFPNTKTSRKCNDHTFSIDFHISRNFQQTSGQLLGNFLETFWKLSGNFGATYA